MPTPLVTLKDKTFRPFMEPGQIAARVAELGAQISADYAGQEVLLVPVLNGSFVFAADLVRQLTVSCRISFIKVSSYVDTESSGEVEEILGLSHGLAGCHVILVEDIVDTGLTMHSVVHMMREQAPASIQIASLLSKPGSIQKPLPLKYVGFEIGPEFVVGYGLDYDGLGREFDGIWVLNG